jgi:hypothetical protein
MPETYEYAGSKVEWDSDGVFTVQSSVDGDQTWQTLVNGREIPGMTNASQSLAIRILFTANEPAETITKVRSLKVVIYENKTMASNRGDRFIQWNGLISPASKAFRPIEQGVDGILQTYTGMGLITPSNLPEDNYLTGAVEMWIRQNNRTSDEKYFVDMRAEDTPGPRVWWDGSEIRSESCAIYIDGVRSSSTSPSLASAEWWHLVVVPEVATNNAIRIGGSFQDTTWLNAHIGHVAVYPSLNDAQIGDLFDSYLAFKTASVGDDDIVSITERATPVKIYGNNWSIRVAG